MLWTSVLPGLLTCLSDETPGLYLIICHVSENVIVLSRLSSFLRRVYFAANDLTSPKPFEQYLLTGDLQTYIITLCWVISNKTDL